MSDCRYFSGLIFLAFALFCLVFPLIQTAYPVVDWVRPLEERRSPTSFPAIALLRGANGNFARQLNAWFDDRVGFDCMRLIQAGPRV